jgi:hypothetical protein
MIWCTMLFSKCKHQATLSGLVCAWNVSMFPNCTHSWVWRFRSYSYGYFTMKKKIINISTWIVNRIIILAVLQSEVWWSFLVWFISSIFGIQINFHLDNDEIWSYQEAHRSPGFHIINDDYQHYVQCLISRINWYLQVTKNTNFK